CGLGGATNGNPVSPNNAPNVGLVVCSDNPLPHCRGVGLIDDLPGKSAKSNESNQKIKSPNQGWGVENMKRFITYARVSTAKQQKMSGLQTQVEDCKKYIEAEDGECVAVIQDDITGVADMHTREGGAKLLTMLRSREADAVVIWMSDRVSRAELVRSLTDVRVILDLGSEFHVTQYGRIHSENDKRLVLDLLDSWNEREKIKTRTMRGRINAVRAGKYIASRAPYGFRQQNKYLVIYEPEARIVRLIFTWYVIGDETGKTLTLREIARRLTAEHVPSPKGKKVFGPDAVVRIIANKSYAGTWEYRKVERVGNKLIKRPAEDLIAVNVPAIVSPEMWQAAQERRAYNRQVSMRNTKKQYLLRGGLVKCMCGAAMTGTPNTRYPNHWYYGCHRRMHGFDGLRTTDTPCKQKALHGPTLEAVVWAHCVKLISDPVKLQYDIDRLRQADEAAQLPLCERLKAVEAQMSEVEREMRGLMAERPTLPAGSLSRRTNEELTAQKDQQYIELQAEQAALASKINQSQSFTEEQIEFALTFASRVGKGIENATFEEKREVLSLMQTKIELIAPYRVKIITKLPMHEATYNVDKKQVAIESGTS
ncbi:MAG: recombinase family protein, partial [Chloroflexi bacterium]|nr:recombinase family protein [Chloroflexota bacterium]